jgi:hypothetical protein
VPDISGAGVVLSPIAVSGDTVFTAVGVAGISGSAPVPQAANKISETRSAKECPTNPMENEWLCLLISLFSTLLDLLYGE